MWLDVVFKTICSGLWYEILIELLIGIIINKELLLISINYYLAIVVKNFGCQIYLTFRRTVLFEVVQLIQLRKCGSIVIVNLIIS